MDKSSVEEWMDHHHVEIIRTHATNLEGATVGKYLNRPKFLKSLPDGHGIGDMALAMDLAGMPHLTFWHEFRHALLGDILLKPDLDTLIWDGTDPDLGHCICDFTLVDGREIALCPRTLLRKVTNKIKDLGYTVKATYELEFFIFRTSFADARRQGYKNLDPVGASELQSIYMVRNAYHAKPFMDEVIKRMNRQEMNWESWGDEGGIGQVELNFVPTNPVNAADTVSRARQIIYEVAVDLEMAVTFMAQPARGYSSGLHIHHSLRKNDDYPFYAENGRSELLLQWIAGIIETMPAATSFLCPTINSYRRLAEFSAPPVTATWGEENKTAALRVITRAPSISRVEHRLAASDANPYLALAVILAGGLAGLNNRLVPPEELKGMGWGLPEDVARLPRTITTAAEALAADKLLPAILGQDVIDYWVNTRKAEWLAFHTEGGDPKSRNTTPWEYKRYFELI